MKVSVVVPVYKAPKFLVAIARRIQADGHPDKEVVAVVDGETATEIAAALAELGSSVTVVNPGVHEDGDFGARAFRLHARYS